MKKGLEMLLRLFYVCMGSFGIWRSIDETFTIPYSRELHPERAVCLLLLLAAAVFCGVICCRRAWLTLLVLGAGIALPFIMGEEPSDGTFLVLVLVMVGDVCSKTGVPGRNVSYKAGLMGIAAGVLACAVGVAALREPLESAFQGTESVKSKIQTRLEQFEIPDLRSSQGTGGVNRGELGRIGEFVTDDNTHLKVRVTNKPEERLYLQGYIGTEYTSDRWKNTDTTEFAKWASASGYREKDVKNLPYVMLKEALGKPEEIRIDREKANALYQYRPYAGQYRKEAVGDTYMKGFGSRHDTIRYYPYKKLSQTKVPEAWRNMEADYQSFVRRVYTDVPEHVRQVFRGEANTRITGLDIDTIAQEIAALLAEQTRYSIYPGATPKGEDFAEYFYFQNKKGYCSHYATVAVLLFRMKGIPARYVAGYVVEPGEFVRDTDGRYAANVTGESAHAWAEVYKPGEGWIPIETTPGYIAEEFREHIPQPQEEVVLPAGEETEQPETERPQEKQEQPEREEAADQADEPNAAGDIRKKERREGAEQGKHRGYAAVVCAAVGICAVILYRQLLARRRKRHSGQTNYNQKTQELFYRIFKKLKKERIVTEETPLNQVFVEKLCGAYADISEEEAARLLELVNRANFGRKELEREEYLFCRQMIFILEKKV